jgi:hypothetical protein
MWLLRSFVALPLVTFKIVAAIHWEALRLWVMGVRLVPLAASRQLLPPPFHSKRPASAVTAKLMELSTVSTPTMAAGPDFAVIDRDRVTFRQGSGGGIAGNSRSDHGDAHSRPLLFVPEIRSARCRSFRRGCHVPERCCES